VVVAEVETVEDMARNVRAVDKDKAEVTGIAVVGTEIAVREEARSRNSNNNIHLIIVSRRITDLFRHRFLYKAFTRACFF
jgi:hypothetical protein